MNNFEAPVYLPGRKPATRVSLSLPLVALLILGVVLGLYLQQSTLDSRITALEYVNEQQAQRISAFERAKLGPSLYLCAETVDRANKALEQTHTVLQIARENELFFQEIQAEIQHSWNPREPLESPDPLPVFGRYEFCTLEHKE